MRSGKVSDLPPLTQIGEFGTSATDTEHNTLPRAGFFIALSGVGVAERDSYPFKSLQQYPNEL